MISVGLQIISMVLCLVGFLQLVVGAKWWDKPVYFYHLFYLGLFLYSGFTLAEELLNGREGMGVHIALNLFIFMRAFTAFAMVYSIVRHLIVRLDYESKSKSFYQIALVIFAAQLLMLFVFHLTKFCYYIDDANRIHITAGYIVLPLVWSLPVVFIFWLLIRYGSLLPRASCLLFVFVGILSLVSAVFQMFFYDIHFFSLSISVAVVVSNLYIINERAILGYQSELEVERLKTDVMLSQIQPHFLYNSLTTIEYLCDRDPQTAKRAVREFAVYLRGNMDSLKASEPIPFERELSHTNAYLALEKLRFEEDLTIKEQIECTSFLIPALTLQPIAENAVRHGVRGKEDGKGTVTITAREADGCFEVIVSDDGNGTGQFDAGGKGGKHIGIQNARYRLEHMCSGSLTVEAVPGKGTTVIIRLPKPKTNGGVQNAGVHD